jgi:Spy/CpxP family protein refolding chaperone
VKPWKVILATLVIFVAGMVTGGLAIKHFQPLPATTKAPPSLQRFDLLRRMEKRLDLTPAQQERIEQIVRESQERTKKAWDQVRPIIRDEFQRVQDRIREELTPVQRKEFEKLLTEPRDRRRQDSPSVRGDRNKPDETREHSSRRQPTNVPSPRETH